MPYCKRYTVLYIRVGLTWMQTSIQATRTVLYCTVGLTLDANFDPSYLYCTVLYCTVLYCRTDTAYLDANFDPSYLHCTALSD